ncbi:MAG: hypothetical protein JWM86_2659, partial [Thermoleophilia bacterium]|nr:hypothetical protein [Thermoleophilia bacterium]
MTPVDRTAIFGPPGSGKAGRVVEAVREGASRDGGAFLVVPNLVDRSRFLRELAASGSTLLDIEVGTWSALVQRIAAAPVRRPDAAMERVLVRQAIERVPSLASSLRWRGFAETARGHVVALRRASVWGGEARTDAVSKLPGGDVAAWDALVEAYGELLRERRLFDDAWLERRMRRRIEARELGVGAVVAYQTLAPTRIQVRMLEAVAQHVPVTVSLPWRGGRGLHDAVSHLRDHWVANGWRVETTSRSTSDDVLEWFAAELFEPSPAPPSAVAGGGGLVPLGFVECSGAQQEAEEVVAEVGRLLAAGVPIGSIAVTAARPDADAALLQGVFRRAGIPLASMLERRAPDVPVGRTLRDLLVAVEDDDPAALVATLGSPGMPVAPRAYELADVALRGAGTVRTIDEAMALPAVARAAPRPVRELVRACSGAPGATSVLDATLGVLAELLPPDEGALRLLTALAAILESLAAAAGRRDAVRLGEIVAAVEGHSLRVPDRVDEGHVVLARILDLGTTRFDAVVVYGLHHGRFGASAERDDEQPA